ncbi:MAG: hypothetical protein R3E65_11760, partial [Steroidobacteraceae bacterium]
MNSCWVAQHANLSLRERHLDAILSQGLEDEQIQVSADAIGSVVNAFDPEFDQQVHTRVTEALDFTVGSLLDRDIVATDDLRMPCDGRTDQITDPA